MTGLNVTGNTISVSRYCSWYTYEFLDYRLKAFGVVDRDALVILAFVNSVFWARYM